MLFTCVPKFVIYTAVRFYCSIRITNTKYKSVSKRVLHESFNLVISVLSHDKHELSQLKCVDVRAEENGKTAISPLLAIHFKKFKHH